MGKDRCPEKNQHCAGFSLLELLIVVAVIMVLAGLIIPNLTRVVHTSRLRGAGTDFAGLLQQARIRAVRDDRYYSVYLLPNSSVPEEFVDIYPQNPNGSSGLGGQSLDPRDPMIALPAEVVQQPWTSAPNTTSGANSLENLFLGNNAAAATIFPGSGAILLGQNPAAINGTGTIPITFGPEGVPCLQNAVTGGTVCNSTGGLVAYWVFFQDNVNQDWEAVTVTPAGRIQRWFYTGTSWGKL